MIDHIGRRTPLLADVRPSGRYLFGDLDRVGGIGTVLKELSPLLRLDALTVSGTTLGEQVAASPAPDGEVVRPLIAPLRGEGTMRVLWGSLAPGGAVIKISAASRELLRHRGPAVVFDDINDLSSRIDDPDLDVSPESVLVLKNSGPAARRVCRNGARCRCRKSSSSVASAIWSGSRTLG